jgi:hypothetical protein
MLCEAGSPKSDVRDHIAERWTLAVELVNR